MLGKASWHRGNLLLHAPPAVLPQVRVVGWWQAVHWG